MMLDHGELLSGYTFYQQVLVHGVDELGGRVIPSALELHLHHTLHRILILLIALPLIPSITIDRRVFFTASLTVAQILTSTILVAPVDIEDASVTIVGHCGAVATV